ncbi:hypothetical protein [Phosphitispora fastidiosa]|uniref:hypothetical protein n=1 Tax=Phosphitispora fastidiosa TaxID=2837202 RepID=UPI001E3E5BCE|nr:hypothetical protein [Phosphitispora fastidiosa]MBU7007113.1 hypothetical protein [Phosphitispora fastidiosa]
MFDQDMVEIIIRLVLKHLNEKGSPVLENKDIVQEANPVVFIVNGSRARVAETLAWLPQFREIAPNPAVIVDLEEPGRNSAAETEWSPESNYGRIIRPTDCTDMEQLLAAARVVVIPWVGQELAARLALGFNDTLSAKIAISAVMQGKPVLAALDDNLLPGNLQKVYKSIPAPYVKLLNDYQKTLRSLNITLMRRDEMVTALRQQLQGTALGKEVTGDSKVTVLTEADILKYHEMSMGEIRTPQRCIVTPLARETAAKLGLTISITR